MLRGSAAAILGCQSVRRAVLITSVLLAALVGSGQAGAITLPCGLPATAPLWIEFSDGSVEWRREVFGKPGVIVATNGVERAAEMRSLGAQTVYWHMNLKGLTGTPAAPRDPAETEQRAHALYDRAVAAIGCEQPVIALNELNGARAPTPWSPTTLQYRQNVTIVMRTLAGRGAVPVLLVPGPARGPGAPNVSGDAIGWWNEIASHGLIVRQLYFNAQYISKRGPIVGSRLRRIAMRQGISALTAIGIPADRLGIMLGFQSGPGKGGRENLQPTQAWLEVIKREALAAKQAAAELGVFGVWSWGWGTFLHFAPEGADPDKPRAACVYLWTRDPALCDGPGAAGPGFNASLTEGQLIVPEGVQCTVGDDTIPIAEVEEIEAATGSRALALRAELQRLVFERAGASVDDADITAAERAAVDASFRGNHDAYLGALAGTDVTRPLAKRALADLLARQETEALATIDAPSTPFAVWLNGAQRDAIKTAVCAADEVPTPGGFEWTRYMPFKLPDATITIQASPRVVRKGQRVTLTGTVKSSRAQEVVTVYALRRGSEYVRVGQRSVDAEGRWQLRVRPDPKGETVFRAASRSSASKPIAVRVKAVKR